MNSAIRTRVGPAETIFRRMRPYISATETKYGKCRVLYKKLSPPNLVTPHYGSGGGDVIVWNQCDMDIWKDFSNMRKEAQQSRSELKHWLTEPSIITIDNYLGISSARADIFDLQAPLDIGPRYYR